MELNKYLVGCLSYFGSILLLAVFAGFILGWVDDGSMEYVIKRENALLKRERVLLIKQFLMLQKEATRNGETINKLRAFISTAEYDRVSREAGRKSRVRNQESWR